MAKKTNPAIAKAIELLKALGVRVRPTKVKSTEEGYTEIDSDGMLTLCWTTGRASSDRVFWHEFSHVMQYFRDPEDTSYSDSMAIIENRVQGPKVPTVATGPEREALRVIKSFEYDADRMAYGLMEASGAPPEELIAQAQDARVYQAYWDVAVALQTWPRPPKGASRIGSGLSGDFPEPGEVDEAAIALIARHRC
jgi:hypothetical protein